MSHLLVAGDSVSRASEPGASLQSAEAVVGARALVDAGALNIIYGSAQRLTSSGSQYKTQSTIGAGTSAPFNRFG